MLQCCTAVDFAFSALYNVLVNFVRDPLIFSRTICDGARKTMREHTGKLNQLPVMNIKAELQKLLNIVVEISTATPFRLSGNKYMCFYCCFDFHESSELLAHTKAEHEDWKLRLSLRQLPKNPTIKLDIKNLACRPCKLDMKDLTEFLDHATEKHSLSINRDICKHVYTYKLSDGDMNCLYCGDKFKFFGPLVMHVNKYHNQLTPFICEICGKSFASQRTVDDHVKVVHDTSGSFPCKKCKEVFPKLCKLRTHVENMHRAHKLRCSKCNDTFPSRYSRKRHLATVHDDKANQFPCPDCNLMFFEKSKLTNHRMKVHVKEKNVTCHICGFKGYNNANLKLHLVSHSDDRPFECEYCKKRFQRKKTMLLHKRIHENDKRYACKDCDKSFVQLTSLNVHLKSHHSANS